MFDKLVKRRESVISCAVPSAPRSCATKQTTNSTFRHKQEAVPTQLSPFVCKLGDRLHHPLTVAQTLELAGALHVEAPGAMEGGLAPDPPVLQTTLQQGGERRRRGRDAEMRALHI